MCMNSWKTLPFAERLLHFYKHMDFIPRHLQHCLVCLGKLGSAVHSQLPVLAFELLLLGYSERGDSHIKA